MATAVAQVERSGTEAGAKARIAARTEARTVARTGAEPRLWLTDIPLGQEVELESLEVGEADLEALLERGVLPGCRLCPVRRSPFGDPIVQVEGTVLALRREMASCLCVRRLPAGP